MTMVIWSKLPSSLIGGRHRNRVYVQIFIVATSPSSIKGAVRTAEYPLLAADTVISSFLRRYILSYQRQYNTMKFSRWRKRENEYSDFDHPKFPYSG